MSFISTACSGGVGGKPRAWASARSLRLDPESGNYGTVTLTRQHAYKGLPCRRWQHDIRIKTVGDPFRFIVDRCKVPDGSWKIL